MQKQSIRDLLERANNAAWEASKDGVKFLRTPRDQAIVVHQDVDLYEVQLHTIHSTRNLRECVLEYAYTVGENEDWTKPYQERKPEEFPNTEEMLLEREAELAVLTLLQFRPKRSVVGLLFDVEETAKQAAAAVHGVLWQDAQLRLPVWAHHALAAGWTAPEGWRP
jgi:hypothetical protein